MKNHKRLHVLRSYEAYCYQVCHYMLQHEGLAVETAKQTLIDLFADASFFDCPQGEKKKIVYQVAVKKSLQTYYARHAR